MTNRRLSTTALASSVALACLAGSARAEPATIVTGHEIQTRGGQIGYTAEAGRLPLVDAKTGAVEAEVFYVAYRMAAKGGPRPLIFLWNGGPGSNSALLHLEAFGPRRIGTAGALEDNADTLLGDADLVFVDAVGTGYSRPTDEGAAERLFSTLGDIAAAADFVQAWRAAHGAQDQPLYLLGESFGVWRVAGTAEALERAGVKVAGVVLISGGLGVGPVEPREAATALRLPNWTAAALFHHRADPSVTIEASKAWAISTWEPALLARDRLDTARRTEVAAGLARFSGLKPDQIDPATLTVSPRQFLRGLLKDQGKTLDTFDMRRTTDSPEPDSGPVTRAYLEGELGYRTDLAYVALGQAYDPAAKPVSERWNYNSAPITAEAMAAAQAGGGPPGSLPWVQRASALDPDLRVFVAAGLYDSLNSCAGNQDTLGRLEPKVAARFSLHCYPGGHMMYRDADARLRLSAEISAFVSRP